MKNITITLKDLEERAKDYRTEVTKALLRDSFYAEQAIELLKDSAVDSLRQLVIQSNHLKTETLTEMIQDERNKEFISDICESYQLDTNLVNQLVFTVSDKDKLTIIEKHFENLSEENILNLLFLDLKKQKKLRERLLNKYSKNMTEETAIRYINKYKSKESMYDLIYSTEFSEDFYDFILNEVKEVTEVFDEDEVFNELEVIISKKKNLSQEAKLYFIEKLKGIESQRWMNSNDYEELMFNQFEVIKSLNFYDDEVLCIKFLEKLKELRKTYSYKTFYKYYSQEIHYILVDIAEKTTSKKVLDLLLKDRTASKHFIKKAIERREFKKDITVKEAIEDKTALNKSNDYGFVDRFYEESDLESLPLKSYRILEVLKIFNIDSKLDDCLMMFDGGLKPHSNTDIRLLKNSREVFISIIDYKKNGVSFDYSERLKGMHLHLRIDDLDSIRELVKTDRFQEAFTGILQELNRKD